MHAFVVPLWLDVLTVFAVITALTFMVWVIQAWQQKRKGEASLAVLLAVASVLVATVLVLIVSVLRGWL